MEILAGHSSINGQFSIAKLDYRSMIRQIMDVKGAPTMFGAYFQPGFSRTRGHPWQSLPELHWWPHEAIPDGAEQGTVGRSQLRHGWRTPKPLEFRIILIGTSDLIPRRRHGFSLKLVNACMNLTDLSPDFCRACADATVYHSGMEPSRSAYTWRFYLAMALRRVRQECDLDCHWPRVELVRKPQEPRVAYTPSKYQRIPSICPRLNSLLVIS